ncbi:MAG: histidine phosphatase family protein [Solirubrobacterales bacterium]
MAKTLLLLRHAKSSRADPGLADHDRPLAPRGQRAAGQIAAYLEERQLTPEQVLCSSSTRTRETLERISPGFSADVEIEIEDELYGASAGTLLARLGKVSDGVETLMVIGHDPGIPELARRLVRRGAGLERLRGKFPTAALATLSFEGSWQELAPGAAELAGLVKPRELEASRRRG